MTAKNKKKIYFGIFWVFLVTSFIFFAALLILVANGYHLNGKNFRLQKTGMLILNGPTDNLTVSLNGKQRSGNLTFKYSQLFPGSYQIVAKKDGYYNWQNLYQIDGGQAVTVDNLILYLTTPKITDLGTDIKVATNINNDFKNQSSNCIIKNDELWYNNKLITRFSQSITAAIYDQNIEHFYVQVGSEVHVLELNGSNNNILIKLPDNNPVAMSSSNNLLKYVSNGNAYSAQLW